LPCITVRQRPESKGSQGTRGKGKEPVTVIGFIINTNYEYNNKKAIINENNPVASAKANPKIA
jgi:hypothetical protein